MDASWGADADDDGGDVGSESELEQLQQLRDQLLVAAASTSSSSSSNNNSDDDDVLVVPSVREVLASLPSNSNSSNNNNNNNNNISNMDSDAIVEWLCDAMQVRVDTAELLPLPQDADANEAAMREGQSALTLTATAVTAAEAYALLLATTGRGGRNAVRMEAVSALSNVLRRWSVECCGRESEWSSQNSNTHEKKNSQTKKKISRRRSNETMNDSSDDSDIDGEGEDDDDDRMETEDPESINNKNSSSGSNQLTPRQLVTAGLSVADAVARIPLQQREFLNYHAEAVEIILVAVAQALATAQAVVASAAAGRSNKNNNSATVVTAMANAVVERATQGLQRCILLEESSTVQVGLDYEDLDDSDDDDDDDNNNNNSDSDDDSEKDDKSQKHNKKQVNDSVSDETMRLRQTTVVAILRGLFPVIAMQETLPKGESGKIEASGAASSVLVGLIDEIKHDILIHPHRWPPSMSLTLTASSGGAARRASVASVASTVPTTGMPSTLPPHTPGRGGHDEDGDVTMMECEPSTPKTANKRRVRKSIGTSAHKRASLTPKTKPKTPATVSHHQKSATTIGTLPSSSDVLRPGPVFAPIVGMLQKLATSKGLEKAAVRGKIVATVHQCLCSLPFAEQVYMLQFLIKQCHSKIAVHRLVASELVGQVLSEDWLWKEHVGGVLNVAHNNLHIHNNNHSSPLSAGNCVRTPSSTSSCKSLTPLVEESSTNMPLALFGALQGRLSDKAPTTRATSATALANVFGRLVEARRDRENTSSFSRSDTGLVAALAEQADGLVQVLRNRTANDEKATVRRAACGALVELLLVCELSSSSSSDDAQQQLACGGITEYDIEILAQVCRQDASLMARRAAADGLTRWMESWVNKSDNGGDAGGMFAAMVQAWTSSTLTMVLDPEASCVAKAVELVERMVIFPIIDGEASKTSKTTAWRILASLGDGAGRGGARGEAEALRVCLEKSIAAADNNNSKSYTNSIFRTIYCVAVATLDSTDDPFAPDVEMQRTGVWTLFEAAMGHTKDQAELARVIKRSKISLDFLGTSWDQLLELFMSSNTPLKSRTALQRTMRKCLNSFSMLTSLVDASVAEKTAASLQDLIGDFSLPPEVLGSAIAALTATTIACCKGESEQVQQQRCASWIRKLFQVCEAKIASFEGSPFCDTVVLARAFFTVGELSLIGFSASDGEGPQQTNKGSPSGGCSSVLARGLYERPTKQLVDYIRAFMAPTLPGSNHAPTPSSVRAHAFIALGKLCLRDPQLAKRSLNVLARELHQNVRLDEMSNNDSAKKDYMVQSNCLLIMGDLCVKYTNMVDRFLPVMAGCLQAGMTAADPLVEEQPEGSALVRKHAILLLSSLLLQDYIKWRGLLFHRFLVATVDEDEDVAQLATMVLFGPLATKQSKLFSNQMVESLFVLNRCTAHPIYQAAAVMGDGGSGISVGFDGINLTGEVGRVRRMRMYQAMLSKMSDEEKIMVTARIGKDILGSSLKHGNELNVVCTSSPAGESSEDYESAFNVLSDALAILSSQCIRVGKNSSNNDEDIEDPNVSTNKARIAQVAKGRLLSNISRKHLIEILLPILCNLKTVLQKSCSPLLKDLMLCIVDVYQRYKTEAEECLANDPTTLQEIQYDSQQHRKAQRQKTPGRKKSIAMKPVSLAT